MGTGKGKKKGNGSSSSKKTKKERSLAADIIIDKPDEPSGGVDPTHEIDSSGYTFASGWIRQDAGTLSSVWGNVNSGASRSVSSADGRTWYLSELSGASLGGGNVVTVSGDTTAGNNLTPASRTFTGVAALLSDSPLAPVMPRYFRVKTRSDPEQATGKGLNGGLLERSSIYLAYDAAFSILREPVWRSAGLPEFLGEWVLRIRRECEHLTAELLWTSLTETEIQTPVLYRGEWSFERSNVLDFVSGPSDSPHDLQAVVLEAVGP